MGAAARAAGMTTLRGSGLARARRGETTFEEVLRVSQVDMTEGHRCTACDRAVDGDMIACPWCATIVDRGHCSSCARPLEAGWKICPWCRTSAVLPEVVTNISVRIPRLLVVGDNGVVHSLVKSAVDDLMDVDVAATADDALTAVWDGEYDGVIVQETLPDIGGVELLRLLRSGSRTAALPLMLVVEPSDDESAGRRCAPQRSRRGVVDRRDDGADVGAAPTADRAQPARRGLAPAGAVQPHARCATDRARRVDGTGQAGNRGRGSHAEPSGEGRAGACRAPEASVGQPAQELTEAIEFAPIEALHEMGADPR